MRILPVLLAASLSGCATQLSLTGKTVPPYPDGMNERSGMCLAGGGKDCAYSLSVVDSDRGGPAIAAALEAVSRDAKGQPKWRVVDSRELPKVRDGFSLEMGSCRVDQHKDESVMAIVKTGDGKFWGDSYWAVRFDRRQKRFVSLPASKVDCASGNPNCS